MWTSGQVGKWPGGRTPISSPFYHFAILHFIILHLAIHLAKVRKLKPYLYAPLPHVEKSN
jgi:hypothetical protein